MSACGGFGSFSISAGDAGAGLALSGATSTYVAAASAASTACASAWTAAQNGWIAAYTAAQNAAQITAALQAAQQVAIAVIQKEAADDAADRMYNIANRQMTIAEWDFDRYRECFVRVEKKATDFVCGAILYEPDYDVIGNRAVTDVRRQYQMARSKLKRTANRFCMDDTCKDIQDLEIAEARAVAAAKDAAYRYEENRADKYYDRWWNQMVAVMNVGRNIQGQQLTTFQAATGNYMAGIGTELSGMNNMLAAISGGLTNVIKTQFAPPTPYSFNQQGFGTPITS